MGQRKIAFRVLLSVFCSLVLIPVSEARTAKEIRYFSMNVHCALDSWRLRIDRITHEIARFNPTVIAFQEVCSNKDTDMPGYIVESLRRRGYNVAFWHTVNTHRTFIHFQEQLMIISSVPVYEQKEGKLPGSLPFLKNNYLGIKLSGTGVDHWVVTTHLNFLLPWGRKKQVKTLTDIWSGVPALIMGDFNTGPNSSAGKVFHQRGWTSFFPGATFPATAPNRALDGFWTSTPLSARIEASDVTKVFARESADGHPVSDHLGVELSAIIGE